MYDRVDGHLALAWDENVGHVIYQGSFDPKNGQILLGMEREASGRYKYVYTPSYEGTPRVDRNVTIMPAIAPELKGSLVDVDNPLQGRIGYINVDTDANGNRVAVIVLGLLDGMPVYLGEVMPDGRRAVGIDSVGNFIYKGEMYKGHRVIGVDRDYNVKFEDTIRFYGHDFLGEDAVTGEKFYRGIFNDAGRVPIFNRKEGGFAHLNEVIAGESPARVAKKVSNFIKRSNLDDVPKIMKRYESVEGAHKFVGLDRDDYPMYVGIKNVDGRVPIGLNQQLKVVFADEAVEKGHYYLGVVNNENIYTGIYTRNYKIPLTRHLEVGTTAYPLIYLYDNDRHDPLLGPVLGVSVKDTGLDPNTAGKLPDPYNIYDRELLHVGDAGAGGVQVKGLDGVSKKLIFHNVLTDPLDGNMTVPVIPEERIGVVLKKSANDSDIMIGVYDSRNLLPVGKTRDGAIEYMNVVNAQDERVLGVDATGNFFKKGLQYDADRGVVGERYAWAVGLTPIGLDAHQQIVFEDTRVQLHKHPILWGAGEYPPVNIDFDADSLNYIDPRDGSLYSGILDAKGRMPMFYGGEAPPLLGDLPPPGEIVFQNIPTSRTGLYGGKIFLGWRDDGSEIYLGSAFKGDTAIGINSRYEPVFLSQTGNKTTYRLLKEADGDTPAIYSNVLLPDGTNRKALTIAQDGTVITVGSFDGEGIALKATIKDINNPHLIHIGDTFTDGNVVKGLSWSHYGDPNISITGDVSWPLRRYYAQLVSHGLYREGPPFMSPLHSTQPDIIGYAPEGRDFEARGLRIGMKYYSSNPPHARYSTLLGVVDDTLMFQGDMIGHVYGPIHGTKKQLLGHFFDTDTYLYKGDIFDHRLMIGYNTKGQIVFQDSADRLGHVFLKNVDGEDIYAGIYTDTGKLPLAKSYHGDIMYLNHQEPMPVMLKSPRGHRLTFDTVSDARFQKIKHKINIGELDIGFPKENLVDMRLHVVGLHMGGGGDSPNLIKRVVLTDSAGEKHWIKTITQDNKILYDDTYYGKVLLGFEDAQHKKPIYAGQVYRGIQ